MHFIYRGFSQDGSRRSFFFQSIHELNAGSIFSIAVDLSLLAKNNLLVQDGPGFCLQLLTTASLAGPASLEKFQNYELVGEDFRPLLKEREKRAAEKALKKHPRRVLRKPAEISNLWGLGRPSGNR